jgi:hypothetical protein
VVFVIDWRERSVGGSAAYKLMEEVLRLGGNNMRDQSAVFSKAVKKFKKGAKALYVKVDDDEGQLVVFDKNIIRAHFLAEFYPTKTNPRERKTRTMAYRTTNWAAGDIERYGTHVTVSKEHGAFIVRRHPAHPAGYAVESYRTSTQARIAAKMLARQRKNPARAAWTRLPSEPGFSTGGYIKVLPDDRALEIVRDSEYGWIASIDGLDLGRPFKTLAAAKRAAAQAARQRKNPRRRSR